MTCTIPLRPSFNTYPFQWTFYCALGLMRWIRDGPFSNYRTVLSGESWAVLIGRTNKKYLIVGFNTYIKEMNLRPQALETYRALQFHDWGTRCWPVTRAEQRQQLHKMMQKIHCYRPGSRRETEQNVKCTWVMIPDWIWARDVLLIFKQSIKYPIGQTDLAQRFQWHTSGTSW